MRFQAAFREIYLNCISGTTRAGLLMLLSFGLIGTVAVTDCVIVSGVVERAEEYRTSGAAVNTVSSPGHIDGKSCENLNRVPDVIAAGALKEVDQVVFSAMPSSPAKHFLVSPSFPKVLESKRFGVGSYVSGDAYNTLATSLVPSNVGLVEIAGTYKYPNDGRRQGLGWAVVEPSFADSSYDECWVLSWPVREDVARLLLSSVSSQPQGGADESAELGQLSSKYGDAFDGDFIYHRRATAWAPLLVFVLGIGISFIGIWIRRVEFASNMQAGARKLGLILQAEVETMLWAIPAALVVFSICIGFGFFLAPTELTRLSSLFVRTLAPFILATGLGVTCGILAIRQKRLWRYVKQY